MEGSSICESISSTPHLFLRPSHQLHIASRLAAKSFLDPLTVGHSTLRRSSNNSLKYSKHGSGILKKSVERKNHTQPLYTNGFSIDQIWEQAVRIITDTSNQLSQDIVTPSKPSQRSNYPQDDLQTRQFKVSEQDVPSSENENSDSDPENPSDLEQMPEKLEDFDEYEDYMDLEKLSDEDESSIPESPSSETYVQDPFNLNDGFFSIDEFNKNTEYLENMDAKGAQEEFSDEEDIDWHIDPAAAGLSAPKTYKKSESSPNQDDDGQSSASEDGPIFNDVDLLGDESDENVQGAIIDETDWIDTTEIKYNDFFAPPPRKVSHQKARPLPKTQPSQIENNDDIELAMSDVRRDLFEDFSESSDQEIDANSNELQEGRSTHERQRAKIADEIRRLELANVAKKGWMLAGEARATERPVNSLIENDLDFERIGKPVPVVTNETSELIEQLIKQRILAKDFDEVIKRLPDMIQRTQASRGRVVVDQSKPQQSLADLYEKDHLRMNDPNFVDEKDENLKRSYGEIEQLWKNTSSLLDALSNWHYKPKIPQPDINVIADVATVMMEEARPSGAGSIGEQATLAPQEIYKAKDKNGFGGEVVSRSGVSMAKDEMSREDKSKRRRKQKESFKNAKSTSTSKTKADEGQQILSDLKKGGVNIVGEKGQLKTVEGQYQSKATEAQAGRLKL
ncbi:U3 small nucleolar ribonucleoprotein Mpp10 [Talaromyces proteolyticus]|uniref:U3 small nucleolar ribonucleoprotein protein MPP10 n=1 Tax=Talaromyces proteolyticus TaxID=1131652 RepID=A0AAD4KJW3_9EURO|nr:U3 small nucleolar ribonucleoprotein Mpp10 [Talaromyces proteolyticus]KAH8693110.1 U3 small nucleolar ribonucleoprotein Mpp10 [Talaromyces proteolyticus]